MKTFALTAAALSASLALAACGNAGDDAATTQGEEVGATAPATDTSTETVVVDEDPAAAPAEGEAGSTLTIDNDGASMDVNEPGVDANVGTDGKVNAKINM